MEYYSSRNGTKIISINDLYIRFSMIIDDFCKRDYFKEDLGNTRRSIDIETINRKSMGQIGISIYPFLDWTSDIQTKDNIFNTKQIFNCPTIKRICAYKMQK